jgi:hypothetical protein
MKDVSPHLPEILIPPLFLRISPEIRLFIVP